MKSRLVAILAIASIFGVGSCKNEMPSVAELQKTFDEDLRPGDPEAKIVDVLKRSGWSFYFDPINRRYATSYPKTSKSIIGVETGIAVWIFVNNDRSVNHVEVVEINGWL